MSLTEIDYDNKHCKYGRFLGNEKFFNKNYGQFMLYEIFKYAYYKIKLNKCYTHVFEDNLQSINSNLKFGMKKEGILRNNVFRNKKFKNVVVFSMLKKNLKGNMKGKNIAVIPARKGSKGFKFKNRILLNETFKFS